MKRSFSFILLSVIISLIISIPSVQTGAAVKIPEKVRIGLYYRNTSEHQDTALSSFAVSCEKGVKIGISKDGNFTIALDENISNYLVRKDSYFSSLNGKLTEYNPAGTQPAGGELSGPFHVKLGSDFGDQAQAKAQADIYRQSGIKAFIAFTGTWQVWTGFYTDADLAGKGAAEVQQQLPGVQVAVVQPAASQIAVFDANNEPKFIFGGTQGVFRIQPGSDGSPGILKINSKSYRGELEVRRFASSDMTVINELPLEQYLYGVVPAEIGAGSSPEALKAQAVTARTYTVNHLRQHANLDFDLCNTTINQVYSGVSAEAASSNKAIDDTAGKVVMYNGKPAQVFYFASSGGWTENVENVWGKDEIPYLKSVEDKYESGKSWRYLWNITYTAQQIKSVMIGRSYDLGNIVNVRITRNSAAGRATQLVITGTKNTRVYEKSGCSSVLSGLYSQWYTITTDADIYALRSDGTQTKTQTGDRKIMTANGIKSVNASSNSVSVIGAGGTKKIYSAVPGKYIFSGRGNGHSIGMSQEGAKGMAKAGFTCEQIISHYFTGATVE